MKSNYFIRKQPYNRPTGDITFSLTSVSPNFNTIMTDNGIFKFKLHEYHCF